VVVGGRIYPILCGDGLAGDPAESRARVFDQPGPAGRRPADRVLARVVALALQVPRGGARRAAARAAADGAGVLRAAADRTARAAGAARGGARRRTTRLHVRRPAVRVRALQPAVRGPALRGRDRGGGPEAAR